MSYGNARFLYENFVTGVSMITAGSQATGAVSSAEKTRGTGAATMYATGSFSHDADLDYIVQIDSVTPGVSVGQSTYRWKTSETGAGWEASGVTTSATLTTLNHDVQVAWRAGSGDDFALEDTFQFFAVATYGTQHLLDLNPNTLFRSGATFPIVIDLGSAQNVKAFVLHNHNLVAGQSTLTLEGNTSDSWGSPAYSQALTIADPLIYYLDETYRYWRLVPVDGVLSYMQAGGLYLGDYLQLGSNAWWGSARNYAYTNRLQRNQPGVARQHAFARQNRLSLRYDKIDNTDLASLVTMQEAVTDVANTGKVSPVYVHLFNDESDTIFLADWTNMADLSQQFFAPDLNDAVELHFEQSVITRG
jgi:hypothetical protein